MRISVLFSFFFSYLEVSVRYLRRKETHKIIEERHTVSSLSY